MIGASWELFLIGWAAAALLMVVLWLIQVRIRDASHVDVGWAYGIALNAALFAAIADGAGSQRALVGVLGAVWGVRLGTYLLLNRIVGKEEDGRYRTLRAKWAPHVNARFFVFFQAQAAFIALFSVPFAFPVVWSHSITPLQWAGAALLACSIVGEILSDRQLAAFRADPANRGQVCKDGLWRYSRHPNYFFAWLSWVAFALVATPAPWGWIAWVTPAFLLLLLFFVTGIPPTEAQSLKSRGEAYRQYQRETSVFVPWFPRRAR
jgi:steroid 5-alpha reductase family enzyme